MKSIDPIHPNFLTTTECYHRAFIEALEHAKEKHTTETHVIVASHNEDTVQFATKTYASILNKNKHNFR
jgi:hypothetical protein